MAWAFDVVGAASPAPSTGAWQSDSLTWGYAADDR